MVHRTERKQLVPVLAAFLNGETTNRSFDGEFSRILAGWRARLDRGLMAIYGFCWNLYDDFEEHRLTGEYALEPPVGRIAARCLLFLGSDFEYEWRRADFIGLNWRRIFSRFLPWVRYEQDPVRRFTTYMNESGGEIAVWPFYRQADYETARAEPDR